MSEKVRCRMDECPWEMPRSLKARQERLVHESEHYGIPRSVAKRAIERLTNLVESMNGGRGWYRKE